MKILKLIIPVFIFMLCLSCDSNISNDENNEADIELNEDAISLTGTKWKLSGIVNVETGEIKVLEPKDCEECFTLLFDTDHITTIRSIDLNVLKLDLQNLDSEILLDDMLKYELYEKDGKYYQDGDRFRRAIYTVESYTASLNELKLYFTRTEKHYLLFKPVKP